jgi:putative phage-type endonuclease
MVELETLQIPYKSEQWYRMRQFGIGGSDASSIYGVSKWKSAIELWEEKTGKREPKDLSGNKAVEYGTKAEEHLTKLFVLDYPQYSLIDTKDTIYRRGFMFASLDGELLEVSTGKKGFLEIKTSEIRSSADWGKWKDKIPIYYYTQILHYFLVTDFEFAYLKVQLKEYDKDGDVVLHTKHYRFEKSDCINDMRKLYNAEKEFYDCVKNNKMPPIRISLLS